MKPNFERTLPGGRPGSVVAVLVCADCNAELGKVLRDSEGATWVNRRARPRVNYADLRLTTGRRFEALPVVASGPMAGAVIWCPVHGDRLELDADFVAGLAFSRPPTRLPV